MVSEEFSFIEYAELCKLAAAEYLEKSTRFNIRNLTFLESTVTKRELRITHRHEFEVTSDAQDHPGVHQPTQNDFGSADWQWYTEQVNKQAQYELRNQITYTNLINTVENDGYASISTRTLIHRHPRRLFHSYTCSGCHGSGKVRCNSCSGSGQIDCSYCSGSGRRRCSNCGGSGTKSEIRQVRDYNGYVRTETQFRSCPSCSGGKVRCSSCGGSGRAACNTCNGSGHVSCSSCSGHGYKTRITVTHTYTNPKYIANYPEGTPSYVHDALCKAGFDMLKIHGDVTFLKSIPNIDDARVDFLYDCEMPFCETELEVQGNKSKWILCGKKPQVFDAGNAIEKIFGIM